MSADKPSIAGSNPVDIRGVFVVGEQRLIDEVQPAIQHRERDAVGRGVVPNGADDVAQQRGLTGFSVTQHHQQRILGEVEFDCGQVFFALADHDPVGASDTSHRPWRAPGWSAATAPAAP